MLSRRVSSERSVTGTGKAFVSVTSYSRCNRPSSPLNHRGCEGTDWIAEPWALGDGTYQIGNFPAGWAEWNGKYRDTMRTDQKPFDDVRVRQAFRLIVNRKEMLDQLFGGQLMPASSLGNCFGSTG